jgi:hypothetical protein
MFANLSTQNRKEAVHIHFPLFHIVFHIAKVWLHSRIWIF